MRAPGVDILRVVVRLDTFMGLGVVDAHGGHPVYHGDAICAGVGAEVLIERAVLLHDDDNMLDAFGA